MSIPIWVEFPGREAQLENVKVAKHDDHTLAVHTTSVKQTPLLFIFYLWKRLSCDD